jgi:hypothetical protein
LGLEIETVDLDDSAIGFVGERAAGGIEIADGVEDASGGVGVPDAVGAGEVEVGEERVEFRDAREIEALLSAEPVEDDVERAAGDDA